MKSMRRHQRNERNVGKAAATKRRVSHMQNAAVVIVLWMYRTCENTLYGLNLHGGGKRFQINHWGIFSAVYVNVKLKARLFPRTTSLVAQRARKWRRTWWEISNRDDIFSRAFRSALEPNKTRLYPMAKISDRSPIVVWSHNSGERLRRAGCPPVSVAGARTRGTDGH